MDEQLSMAVLSGSLIAVIGPPATAVKCPAFGRGSQACGCVTPVPNGHTRDRSDR